MSKLVRKEQNAIEIATKFGIDRAIKPLTQEIFLQDYFVNGVIFAAEKLQMLKIGQELAMQLEDTPFGEQCITVAEGDKLLGELMPKEAEVLIHLMQAGKKLTAKVKNIVIQPEYAALQVSIFMTDF